MNQAATSPETRSDDPGEIALSGPGKRPPANPPQIRNRFRIRFAKTGLLRWIGHRDLQRLWERMLRRTGLQLSMSEGFHPKPRISFPSALALGIEGLDEVVEIELAQSITVAELRERLINDQQPGLTIGEVTLMAGGDQPPGTANSPGLCKAKLLHSDYEIEIPEGVDLVDVDRAIASVSTLGTVTLHRKEKPITVVVATVFPVVERRQNQLRISQLEVSGPTLKVSELLDLIGLGNLIPAGAVVRRVRVHLTDENSSDHATH